MKKPITKILWVLFILGISLVGCDGKQETTLSAPSGAIETELQDYPNQEISLRIEGIRVIEGEAIEFWGRSSVPDGSCLYTQLYEDDLLLEWWPAGKCFPITDHDWKFRVPLVNEGAPGVLDASAQYRLQVWWPGAPETAADVIYFDLSSPPAP